MPCSLSAEASFSISDHPKERGQVMKPFSELVFSIYLLICIDMSKKLYIISKINHNKKYFRNIVPPSGNVICTAAQQRPTG